MAYLNVRERRLETKIAYVGPRRSGKGTNLERLGDSHLNNDVRALYWTPLRPTLFRDCAVRVELVASRGESSREKWRALLRDADAVVFVADARPSAQPENRAAVTCLREVLDAEGGRNVPVVVQVNKGDLPDAVPVATVLEGLDLAPWSHLGAVARDGQGVIETVERALEGVLASLQRDETVSASGLEAEEAGAPAVALPVAAREGNPLLTALRQILRDTIDGHAAAVEERLQAALARDLDALRDDLRAARDEHKKMRAALEALRLEIAAQASGRGKRNWFG